MVKDTIVLKNETGLQARPASELAKLAASFKSSVKLNVNGKTVDAKSILGIMAAGIKYETEIEIECEGEDEEKALSEIIQGFNNNFGEEQK